jgi:hypothetical protein
MKQHTLSKDCWCRPKVVQVRARKEVSKSV